MIDGKKKALGVMSALIGVLMCAHVLFGCDSKSQPVRQSRPDYHILVVLDLSDRIDQRHSTQVTRDKAVLSALLDFYESLVRERFFVASKDSFQIAIATQPVPYRLLIESIGDSLRIDMRSIRAADRVRVFASRRTELMNSVDRLYDRAARIERFPGADLWGFFRDHLSTYLSAEAGSKNVVVVLTDGYIEFERSEIPYRQRHGNRADYMMVDPFTSGAVPFARFDRDDYGLLSVSLGEKFRSNTSVLVLEACSKQPLSPRELEVVQKYWSKWFDEMGLSGKNMFLTNEATLAHVREVVHDFAFADLRRGAEVARLPPAPEPSVSSGGPASHRVPIASSIVDPSTPADRIPQALSREGERLERAGKNESTSHAQQGQRRVNAHVQFVYRVDGDSEQLPVLGGVGVSLYAIRFDSSGKQVGWRLLAHTELDKNGSAVFSQVPCGRPFKVLLDSGSVGERPRVDLPPNRSPMAPLGCADDVDIGKYVLNLSKEPEFASR
jgi:hypothetical protein